MPDKSIADIITQGGYGVLGRLSQILTSKADLVDGKVNPDQIPTGTGKDKLIGINSIIMSPTEPTNPQEGDLWLDSSGT
jgi:hypothetical protein